MEDSQNWSNFSKLFTQPFLACTPSQTVQPSSNPAPVSNPFLNPDVKPLQPFPTPAPVSNPFLNPDVKQPQPSPTPALSNSLFSSIDPKRLPLSSSFTSPDKQVSSSFPVANQDLFGKGKEFNSGFFVNSGKKEGGNESWIRKNEGKTELDGKESFKQSGFFVNSEKKNEVGQGWLVSENKSDGLGQSNFGNFSGVFGKFGNSAPAEVVLESKPVNSFTQPANSFTQPTNSFTQPIHNFTHSANIFAGSAQPVPLQALIKRLSEACDYFSKLKPHLEQSQNILTRLNPNKLYASKVQINSELFKKSTKQSNLFPMIFTAKQKHQNLISLTRSLIQEIKQNQKNNFNTLLIKTLESNSKTFEDLQTQLKSIQFTSETLKVLINTLQAAKPAEKSKLIHIHFKTRKETIAEALNNFKNKLRELNFLAKTSQPDTYDLWPEHLYDYIDPEVYKGLYHNLIKAPQKLPTGAQQKIKTQKLKCDDLKIKVDFKDLMSAPNKSSSSKPQSTLVQNIMAEYKKLVLEIEGFKKNSENQKPPEDEQVADNGNGSAGVGFGNAEGKLGSVAGLENKMGKTDLMNPAVSSGSVNAENSSFASNPVNATTPPAATPSPFLSNPSSNPSNPSTQTLNPFNPPSSTAANPFTPAKTPSTIPQPTSPVKPAVQSNPSSFFVAPPTSTSSFFSQVPTVPNPFSNTGFGQQSFVSPNLPKMEGIANKTFGVNSNPFAAFTPAVPTSVPSASVPQNSFFMPRK